SQDIGQGIIDLVGVTKTYNIAILIHGVSLSLRGSGRLDTRLDTPPISLRHHPGSGLAPRSTNRSVRSRTSRVSTKPESETVYIGLANTTCATHTVFHVAAAKPAARAAIITAIGNIFCRRSRNAARQSPVAATAATEATGS